MTEVTQDNQPKRLGPLVYALFTPCNHIGRLLPFTDVTLNRVVISAKRHNMVVASLGEERVKSITQVKSERVIGYPQVFKTADLRFCGTTPSPFPQLRLKSLYDTEWVSTTSVF